MTFRNSRNSMVTTASQQDAARIIHNLNLSLLEDDNDSEGDSDDRVSSFKGPLHVHQHPQVPTATVPYYKNSKLDASAMSVSGISGISSSVVSSRDFSMASQETDSHLDLDATSKIGNRQGPSTITLTPPTHPLKDHPFQLVHNPLHRELGMLQCNYNTIKEVTTQFLLSPDKTLKPILSIDVEIPGDTHMGKHIFSHPLIVEAIETYFVVVAAPQDVLPQNLCETTSKCTANPSATTVISGTSKMSGNYVYTRVRILDPLTGCDLVPCLDKQLSKGSLLQAMLDALAMVCPDQAIPKYLTNLLEEEQGTTHAAAMRQRRQDLCHHQYQYRYQQQQHSHIPNHILSSTAAPKVVIGLEHTALGEIVFAELEGVLATQAGWVLPKLDDQHHSGASVSTNDQASANASTRSIASTSSNATHSQPPSRQAVITVSYDPNRLSYCTLAKFAVKQHANQKLGKPSGLTLYHTSHEEQVAAQMHIRAHYRQLMEQVDPNNPAQHYYAATATASVAHETIRTLPLRVENSSNNPSSASSTDSSEESYTGLNNSRNKTHPGYKVPDYDGVVEHAAAKAAAEAAGGKDKAPKYSYVLKPLCNESLQLQCSKPALRESHLRFVPLTPLQATRANRLVYQGKFHLAMKLLSPRQGMLLMQALRSGKPKKCCHDELELAPAPATNAPSSIEDAPIASAQVQQQSSPAPQRRSSKCKPRSGSVQSTKSTSSKPSASARADLPSTATKTGTSTSPKSTQTKKLRRASTSEGLRRFPKQKPRMSLNAEALKHSASLVAASMDASSSSAPPVRTIDTSRGSPATNKPPELEPMATGRTIEYEDVVDVPILDAWKPFVVYPEGVRPDSDCDDEDYISSDDNLSLSSGRSY